MDRLKASEIIKYKLTGEGRGTGYTCYENVKKKLSKLDEPLLRKMAESYFDGTIYTLSTDPTFPFSEEELEIIINDIYKPFYDMLDAVADALSDDDGVVELLQERGSSAYSDGQQLEKYVDSGQVRLYCPVDNTIRELAEFPKLQRFERDLL